MRMVLDKGERLFQFESVLLRQMHFPIFLESTGSRAGGGLRLRRIPVSRAMAQE